MAGLKFTPVHITVFGLAVSLIESYTRFFSGLTGYGSEYIFWLGVIILFAGFLLGMKT